MTSSYARQINGPLVIGPGVRMVLMEAAPRQLSFLPSLGMVWRGMWGLALVPVTIDETTEADASVDA